MDNDLRQNPRFIMSGGVAARVRLDGEEQTGFLQNFSSTGFAVLVDTAPKEAAAGMLVEVRFQAPGPGGRELRLSAEISNRRQEEGQCRLGCRIIDMHDHSEAYFAFLTKMMFSQGLIRSMATKPVKYRGE